MWFEIDGWGISKITPRRAWGDFARCTVQWDCEGYVDKVVTAVIRFCRVGGSSTARLVQLGQTGREGVFSSSSFSSGPGCLCKQQHCQHVKMAVSCVLTFFFFFPLEVCFLLWLKAQVRLLCLTSAPSHCAGAFAICCLQRLKSGCDRVPTASLCSLCRRDLCYTMLFLASPSRGGELVFPPSPGEDASPPANNWWFLMTRVSTGYWGKGWSISSPGLAAWSSFGLSSYSLPCGSMCKVLCKPICHISWSICFFALSHVVSWRADGG